MSILYKIQFFGLMTFIPYRSNIFSSFASIFEVQVEMKCTCYFLNEMHKRKNKDNFFHEKNVSFIIHVQINRAVTKLRLLLTTLTPHLHVTS